MSAEKDLTKPTQAQGQKSASPPSEQGRLPTKTASKPVILDGWAHPSQKADDSYLAGIGRPQHKPVREGSNPVIGSPRTATSLAFIESSSARRGAVTQNMPTAEKVASTSNTAAARVQRKDNAEPTLASQRSDPKTTQSDPKLITVNPIDEKTKKRSIDKPDVKVSIADPADDPKRKSNVLGKRRHTKKLRKEKMAQERNDPQSENVSGDMAVVHPDFLDESFLEVVDNENRKDSRVSSEYEGTIKPLRFTSQKNKKAQINPAFKERVHKTKRRTRARASGSYDWEVSKRLPDDVVPFQYTVYLEPHIESNIFFGRVSIAIDLVLPKSQIWLHARNLHITSTQVFDQNDNQIPVLGAHKFRKHEFFVIFFEGNLRPGIYMINIDYNSILSSRNIIGLFTRDYKSRDGSTRLQGFFIRINDCKINTAFPSQVQNSPNQIQIGAGGFMKASKHFQAVKGVGPLVHINFPEADFNRHLVYTQLEPIYARRVFPCFDEPSFKATYDIAIVRPSHEYTVICNMPIDNEEEEVPQRGYTTVRFSTTPLMSTYHFSIIVCDFHTKPVLDPRINFPFTVYSKDEKVEAVQDTIKIALNAIAWCQEYFQMAYPHPKLDLIIMPELSPISVEGLSVILIQESLMKIKEDYEYETLHYTLTREIISQWIGTSATVTWWGDLWYKEGLTMMLANLFLDQNYPEVQAIPNFICYLLQPCMYSDILLSARKIDREITDPNDISEYMDPVAFTKAAAVFRMIEQMDPEYFKQGLRNFMSTYHLQSASWKQLSECLHMANEKNPNYLLSIENVIYSWSQYPGHPLVVSARGLKAIAMTHRRLLSSMDCKTHNLAYFPTWEFPISYMLSPRPEDVNLLYMKADTIDTEIRNSLPESVTWYKVNVRQTGFYRVVYPEEDWNNLKKMLLNKPQFFSVEDRANIIDDMFSLSRAGFLCYGRTFMTLTYLRYGKENSWLPWACLLKHLVFLKNALSSDENDLRNFKSFISYLLDPVLSDDVWNVSENDEELVRRWKMAVLKVACTMEIPTARNRLHFLQQRNDFDIRKWNPKPYLLRFLFLRYGVPNNGYTDSDWLALWKLYQNEKNKLEKHKLLAVIASVANENQRNSLMKTIRTDEKSINDHAFFTVLYEMASSRRGALYVWNFIKNNWSYLTERFASTDSRLFLLFPHVAQSFDDEKLLQELQEFTTHDIPTLDAAITQANNNIYWTNKYRRTVSSWLNNVQRVLRPLGYSKHGPLRRNKQDLLSLSGSQQLGSHSNLGPVTGMSASKTAVGE